MQQSQPVVITTRRSDASLVARVTLDPKPDPVIGDDLLDRVASVLYSAAGDLTVASIGVFPPAIVFQAVTAGKDFLPDWDYTRENIEGNACFTRPRPTAWNGGVIYDPSDRKPGKVYSPSPAVSEPVSEAISEPISGAESGQESGQGFGSLDDLQAFTDELRARGVPADLDYPGYVFASVGPLEWGFDGEAGGGVDPASYRLNHYENSALTAGDGNPERVSLFGLNNRGRAAALDEFAEVYHEARREAEGVLDDDEADVALAKAVKALVPSAEHWHTGGGCYAVQAETPLGLFVTVATVFPAVVVTYSQGSVDAYDLGDECVGFWDIEQAVAGGEEEDGVEFTQARIDAFAADFAEQFAWASALEKSDPTPVGGGREHDDVARILVELEKLDCTLVAAAHEPGDEPFWTVLALRRRPVFPDKPYVVWGAGYYGLSNGHYDLSRERGFQVFRQHVVEHEEV